MKSYHSNEKWLNWIDELAQQDYVIIDDFLSDSLYQEVRTHFLNKIDEFDQAGIGSLDNHMIKRNIRGDFTYWLDRKRDSQLDFWNLLDETMQVLNRYCFLSLSGFEFHFAHYPSGGHYDKHVDQFADRNNRMISVVIYLNEGWTEGDGGELEIFTSEEESFLVQPVARRCAMFKSAIVPHAVCHAHKSRYSLTGWLLYQPAALGKFLT